MVVIKFSHKKGVYMLVSAISANNQTVNNIRVNSRGGDNVSETSYNYINSFAGKMSADRQSRLFDSINEWKYFCHRQIEKGNLDLIV